MDRIKLADLYERFMVAVEVLATSRASLQRRLEGAYRSFIDIEPKDFDDEEMQATFEQIRSRLTRVQHGQVDSIAATCRQMSDQEAAEVADFIFSLFLRMGRNITPPPDPMDKNMFVGHYGVAFAAKPVGVRLEARAPLWVWFIGVTMDGRCLVVPGAIRH